MFLHTRLRSEKNWRFTCFLALILAAGAVFVLLAQSIATFAAEFCVRCDNPPGSYVCTVGSSEIQTPPAGSEFLCISEIAKSRGHGRCRISRRDEGPCSSKVVVVTPPTGQIPPQPLAAQSIEPPAPETDDEATTNITFDDPQYEGPFPSEQQETADPAAPADATPNEDKSITDSKTVVELAERTAESSKEGISKAGEAIGTAAKKTWKCVSTLFFDCF